MHVLYINVKPVVLIVVSMDLHVHVELYGVHALREATCTILGGATIAFNAVFRGGYYSRDATKQRRRLFEEIQYVNILLII